MATVRFVLCDRTLAYLRDIAQPSTEAEQSLEMQTQAAMAKGACIGLASRCDEPLAPLASSTNTATTTTGSLSQAWLASGCVKPPAPPPRPAGQMFPEVKRGNSLLFVVSSALPMFLQQAQRLHWVALLPLEMRAHHDLKDQFEIMA